MSHVIQWDNAEKTVVLQQYADQAVKDDLYDLSKQSAEMLRSVSHRVHLIIDERPIKVTLRYDSHILRLMFRRIRCSGGHCG